MPGKVVILGASGLAGTAALKRFTADPGWEVTAVSRRTPIVPLRHATHLSVDLLDKAACAESFGRMTGVTHLVYAAVNERQGDMVAGWADPEQNARNVAMLSHVMDPLLAASPGFRHVSLIHGLKAYGTHLPEVKLPLPMRESSPRIEHSNWYFEQQAYLEAKQAGSPWHWTIFRPCMIAGDAVGANMNPFLVLAVFATLRREAGQDLPMPAGSSLIVDATDADIIAAACAWAADAPTARDEAFNLSNGDVLAVHDAFPVVADALGMTLGPRQRYDIIAEIRRMADAWPEIVRRHRLHAPESLDDLLGNSLEVGGTWTADIPPEMALRWGVCSTIKVRQAGFPDCIDTLQMVRKYMTRFRELRIIP